MSAKNGKTSETSPRRLLRALQAFRAEESRQVNREILRLALPNIVANVSVPLLGMADTVIVGHLEAPHYIGALALGTAIFNFLYWGFGFLAMGTTGVTAQAWGAGDRSEVRRLLQRGLLVAGLLGAVMILLQGAIGAVAFHVMDSTPEVLEHARSYFAIRIWAAPATLSLMVVQGWFLGVQNARTPMLLTVAVNLLNILASLGFVMFAGMDSDGVAWGTLAAQYCGVLLGLLMLRSFFSEGSGGRFSLESGLLETQGLKRFFQVNRDILIRTLALITVFTFFTMASAQMGEDILAANSLLLQLWMLVSFAIDGFANAGQGLVGRYTGGRDTSALRRCVGLLILWAAGIGVVFALVYGWSGEWLLHQFTRHEEIVALASVYLPWLTLGALLNLFAFIWDGIFLGATATRVMRNAMLLCTAGFFGMYLLFQPLWFNHGLWLALTTFMILRGASLTWLAPGHILGSRPRSR